MADFQPLRALRYDPSIAGDPATLVSPPYDVVSQAAAAELYARSPYNIARVDNGENRPGDSEKDNRYTRAAAELSSWLAAGALKKDAVARNYVYDQEFALHGQPRRRRAVFGRVRLADWDEGIVLPHEYTGSSDKADRLNLLRETRVHLSPIFMMYEGGDAPEVNDSDLGAPVLDAVLEGERHTLRPLSEAAAARFAAYLTTRRLYVADGHHRYETALNYRAEARARAPDWTGEEPENFVLAALVDVDEPDLVVLPTHRLITAVLDSGAQSRLHAHFDITDAGSIDDHEAVGGLEQWLAEAGREGNAFAAAGLVAGRLSLLKPRDHAAMPGLVPGDHSEDWRSLDVNVLEHVVYRDLGYAPTLENIAYTEEIEAAAAAVRRGECNFAILLNPTPVAQVVACSNVGDRMPRKSTFFYPKLGTGLVLYPFD